MQLIDATNAAAYLRQRGWIDPAETVDVAELAGGVSNVVLYVGRAEGTDDFVLKQARHQLRTPEAWYCGVERIWREVEVLRICEALLARQQHSASDSVAHVITPRILQEDRENFAFAMTAAPREHRVWKQELLAGHCEPNIAAACGELLATLHGGTWHDANVAARLDDLQVFDQLRLDPYYRRVAEAQPAAREHFEHLCESAWQQRHSLVHADFSPKNLLVYPGGLMMLDFETGHYGDPAFDLGFFLSHLVLKAHHAAPRHGPYLELIDTFWHNYAVRMQPAVANEYDPLVARGLQHLAGCAWARLDGKSQIDYLHDSARRDAVRDYCRWLFAARPTEWTAAAAELRTRLDTSS